MKRTVHNQFAELEVLTGLFRWRTKLIRSQAVCDWNTRFFVAYAFSLLTCLISPIVSCFLVAGSCAGSWSVSSGFSPHHHSGHFEMRYTSSVRPRIFSSNYREAPRTSGSVQSTCGFGIRTRFGIACLEQFSLSQFPWFGWFQFADISYFRVRLHDLDLLFTSYLQSVVIRLLIRTGSMLCYSKVTKAIPNMTCGWCEQEASTCAKL